MTEAYADFLAFRQAKKTEDEVAYLMHYGVKGQKWGERKWQNADGTYTEEGKHHYGWGYGRPPTAGATSPSGSVRPRYTAAQRVRRPAAAQSPQAQQTQPTASQQEIEARKARRRKIIGIAAGVAVTAAVSYAAYKGSTKLRDSMREDVVRNMNTDASNLHTINSKYWDAVDRKKYTEMSTKRAKDISDSLTRSDAVSAKLFEKTGIRVNLPQSRSKVLAERRSANEYANFIRDAERRGSMNRSIHDARADLRKAKEDAAKYRKIEHIGNAKKMEGYWNKQHDENIAAAKKRLDDLLLRRRSG